MSAGHQIPLATFSAAAQSFAGLVRRIPDGSWDGPGLGDWDLRALAGHTSRALVTTGAYLHTDAEREDLHSPEAYYAHLKEGAPTDPAAVAERGRKAGADLGVDPAAFVDALTERVLGELAGADNRLIGVIGGLGIRLSNYLPTRTFELAVHSLDIARAANIDHSLPDEVLAEAVTLAARTAVMTGQGATVLMALTGRTALPQSFSVV